MTTPQVFVAGAGLMGSGIAQVCAQAGMTVTLYDIDPRALERARENIAWSAEKLIQKGKTTGPLEAVMARIQTSRSLEDAASAQVVIEAVFEDLAVKRELFTRLGRVVEPDTLVASNTSAIPISELAGALPHPQRFLGLHFFSPVPMMAAVEVIRGALTSEECFQAGRRLVESMGKTPILVQRDIPGFVINRVNLPSTIEAIRLVEEGVATVEDIDQGVRLGLGRRMGIFETGDLVGLDVTLGALTALYRETGQERWFPPVLLRRKVQAGQLGRKTGVGWYRYDQEGRRLGPA